MPSDLCPPTEPPATRPPTADPATRAPAAIAGSTRTTGGDAVTSVVPATGGDAVTSAVPTAVDGSGARSSPPAAQPPGPTASARAALLDWPDELLLVPWVDPLVDRLGHDARSPYVETFWLGVLGPSATWLLRRAAAWLDASPDGVLVDLEEVAGALGLGGRGGRRLPFYRALDRCVVFGMVQRLGDDQLAVRRRLPPLSARHLTRLPATIQEQHRRWMAHHQQAAADDAQERARQLALSLLRMGEDAPAVEQQLARWRVHPATAHAAVAWALAHERGTVAPGPAPAHPAGSSRQGAAGQTEDPVLAVARPAP